MKLGSYEKVKKLIDLAKEGNPDGVRIDEYSNRTVIAFTLYDENGEEKKNENS